MDLTVEHRAAQVVDLEVPFELREVRQAGRIDGLHGGQVCPLVRELLVDGVDRAAAKPVVRVVNADERGERRMLAHQPSEPGFDEVEETLVERTCWVGNGSGQGDRGRIAVSHGTSGWAL